MKKLLLAVVIMMAMTTQANASLKCEGVPNSSMSITWGILYVDIGHGTWDLCSIESERNGISKEVCITIQKAVLLAESEGKKVQFTFDAPGMTCGELINTNGDWHTPDPFPYHMNFSK